MSEYTPTTEDLRDLWRNHFYEGIAEDEAKADAGWDDERMYAQFDRAIASIVGSAAEKALRAAADAYESDDDLSEFMHSWDWRDNVEFLRARADRIAEDGKP